MLFLYGSEKENSDYFTIQRERGYSADKPGRVAAVNDGPIIIIIGRGTETFNAPVGSQTVPARPSETVSLEAR